MSYDDSKSGSAPDYGRTDLFMNLKKPRRQGGFLSKQEPPEEKAPNINFHFAKSPASEKMKASVLAEENFIPENRPAAQLAHGSKVKPAALALQENEPSEPVKQEASSPSSVGIREEELKRELPPEKPEEVLPFYQAAEPEGEQFICKVNLNQPGVDDLEEALGGFWPEETSNSRERILAASSESEPDFLPDEAKSGRKIKTRLASGNPPAASPAGTGERETAKPRWNNTARLQAGPREIRPSFRPGRTMENASAAGLELSAPMLPLAPNSVPAALLSPSYTMMQYIRLQGKITEFKSEPEDGDSSAGNGWYRIAVDEEQAQSDCWAYTLFPGAEGKDWTDCRIMTVDPYSVLTGLNSQQIERVLNLLNIAAPEPEAVLPVISPEAFALMLQVIVDEAQTQETGDSLPNISATGVNPEIEEWLQKTAGAAKNIFPKLQFDLSIPAFPRYGPMQAVLGPYRILTDYDGEIQLKVDGPPRSVFLDRRGSWIQKVAAGEDFHLAIPRHSQIGAILITASVPIPAVWPLILMVTDESGRCLMDAPVLGSSLRLPQDAKTLHTSLQIMFYDS